MNDINQQVMQNYQENISYFEQTHPAVYNKIKALEILLEDGRFTQKYDLEYRDNYFDVINLTTKSYLYKENSTIHTKKLIDNISYTKNKYTIETFSDYRFEKNIAEYMQNISPYAMHAATAPIIDYYNQNIEKSTQLKHINKFILFGNGLGVHLEEVLRKIGQSTFFIIEDDIELFRLSLFTTNYKKIFQNSKTFFAIALSDVEFAETCETFLHYEFIKSHFIKFSLFSPAYEKYIKKVQVELLKRPEKCYPYNSLLLKNKKVLNRIDHHYKYLNMLKKHEIFLDNKPLLIIGAGPSLGVNIEWLKQNHQKFIIIAPFMTIRLFFDLDIHIDIIVHIDENDAIAEKEILRYKDKLEYFKNSLFIFFPSVSNIFFKTFNSNSIYLLEDSTSYIKNNNYINDVFSVGEAIYAIALSLSNYDIYLLGIDLSRSSDGASHYSGHKDGVHDPKAFKSTVEELDQQAGFRSSHVIVKGNFKKTVETIPLFLVSIDSFNRQTKKFKNKSQHIYNLSDGAYFEETTPLHINNINQFHDIDKTHLQADLSKILDKYSQKEFRDIEFQGLKQRAQNIEQYNKLLTQFKQSSSSNDEMFTHNFIWLTNYILEVQEDELQQILITYILTISSYIIDFFNTQGLEDKKRHIKKIKKIFLESTQKIIDTYSLELSKTIERIQ